MKGFQFLIAAIIALLVFAGAFWPTRVNLSRYDLQDSAALYELNYDQICLKILQDSSLYEEGWDTLVQTRFWQTAMTLPPDTILVNIARTREIIDTLTRFHSIMLSPRRKKAYEDSVKRARGMRRREEVYFTTGRNHFYQIHKVLPEIDKAVEIFAEEDVDPWYAQSILLIESPGRLQFSTDGAYGAFQLMKGVAREVGLIVNDTLDEREIFEKSAMGAARLIDRVCLPHARKLCKDYRLDYQEDDLWFRLLTMHVYHAGIGNVRRAIRKVRPQEGGQTVITGLWKVKSRRFGNASQNYSQIILASLINLDRLIQTEGIICPPT